MKKILFVLLLILSLLFLVGCTLEDSTSCLLCRSSWIEDIKSNLLIGGIQGNFSWSNVGFLTLNGKSRVLKTFQYSATSAKGSGSAVLGSLGLDSCLIFDDSKSDTASLAIALRNDMDRSAKPEIRIGWSSPVTTGYIVWKIEYLYRSVNESTASVVPDEAIIVRSPVSSISEGYTYTNFKFNYAPSSTDRILQIRLTRLGTNINDTALGVGNLIGILFEYTSDKLGSPISS